MTKRPDSVSILDIKRWEENIDNDPNLPKIIINDSTIREVCLAGLFLIEELDKLKCPNNIAFSIQEAAGRLSFGRDPWEVSQSLIFKYKNNELIFQNDIDLIDLN